MERRKSGRSTRTRHPLSALPSPSAPATFDIRLALGQPDAFLEARVKAAGFKDEIDATTWLISEVTHRLSKMGGFSTDLKMDTER